MKVLAALANARAHNRRAMNFRLRYAPLALLLLALSACAEDPPPETIRLREGPAAGAEIQVINAVRLPRAELDALEAEYLGWAKRVYAYFKLSKPEPVKLKLVEHSVGFYVEDTILVGMRDRDDALESWIHELTHHATGHDSSFFFKEGIATHTLEKLFREERRMPQGWPQYGKSNDAWVNLFLQRKQLMPLQQALNWEHYVGFPPEQDFHSWQIYCMGGSFAGWFIRTHGMDAFLAAFQKEELPEPVEKIEQQWLDDIRQQKLALFDPAEALPDGFRYRAFAKRLAPAN